MPGIHISNLSYRYFRNGPAALSNVDLSVPAGCCFGLLGHNGAGKTTLISLLVNILRPHEGSIEYIHPEENSNTTSESSHQEGAIFSLVPQNFAFYPTLTGRQNLQYFGQMHKLSGQILQSRIHECIEICGLDEVVDRQAKQYSGGMKRRLNIALGLINKPRLLYLDEPTVGIDPRARAEILQTIKSLHQNGMTIVYTSHYLDEVEYLCDELAILHQGKVLVSGTHTELLRQSGQTILELFEPVLPSELSKLEQALNSNGQQSEIHATDTRLFLNSALPLSTIIHAVEGQQLGIRKVYPNSQRLEDLYLALTQTRTHL